MNLHALVVSTYVAADIPITRDNVKPGWIALGVVAALIVVLVLLVRSMVKHTRRASEPWEGDPDPDDPPTPGSGE